MMIGHYKVLSVLTSQFALDGGAMFGSIPKTLWEKKIRADEQNRIPMCTRSLLLASEDRKILIDTGNGDKWDDKYRSIYQIDIQSMNLVSSLNTYGYSLEDITDVICTHLHFDHAGGNTRFDERGKIVPTFPNATYWIQKSNWKLANSPSEKDRASYLSQNWRVLSENNLIKFIDGNEEVFPDIQFIITNGHTTGQQHPLITDGTVHLFFAGDLFPTATHIPIPWIMGYDIYPLQTIQEKRLLLPKIVEEEWLIFLEHDRYREIITVNYNGKSYGVKSEQKLDQIE